MIRYFTIILLIILLPQCNSKKDQEYLLRVSLWANEDHNWYKAFTYFGGLLEERSRGRMKVEVYPSEQLAKEIESIRLIQAEVIEMTVTGSLLSNWIDIAAFCEMPFLLSDSTDKHALIYGPLGKRIEQEMLSKVGLRPIAIFDRGPRQLTSNRLIKDPDDLNGLILRVPNVPSFVTAWSAMGAKPTPMALSEVFTSLQQGTIEAQENPLALILTAGFAEVQKYVTMTNHVMSWSYPVIGEKQFQEMPNDLKEIFLTTARDMQEYQHQLFREHERKLRDQLEEKGMEFIEVDNNLFKQKCEATIFNSLNSEMQGVYQEFTKSRKNQ